MHYEVTIGSLVFGGQAIGTLPDGKKVFVWNALPGEQVQVELTKNKKDYAEGIAVEILEASPHRMIPKEESYLSTAPWQIMDYAYENECKVALAKQVYKKIGNIEVDELPIYGDDTQLYGYRNKIEFSFWQETEDDEINLAFFQRGSKWKIEVTESLLADAAINDTAQHILAWIREQGIPVRSLKSLIIRTDHKQTIAALFIKDELEFTTFPDLTDTLVGFKLYYSTHKSPASVPTKLLYESGQDFLTANINGTDLRFGLLSFFQVNIPLFESALDHIAKQIPSGTPLIDMYAGVGAIGLPLSSHVPHVTCIESNEEAVAYCQDNIRINNIDNAEVVLAPAEQVLDYITPNETVILDPPRAGLHPDLVHHLLWALPERIVYMSCNLSTQARDLQLLSESYTIDSLELFNFFPRTPHIEGLAILSKI
jgi:23S rRNA (uracil1939-C5)-methyltransferase